MATGRAVMFTAEATAELQEVPLSGEPRKPDEVAGHTLISLISPGTETQGGYLGTHFPTGSGYAAVFELDEVGAEVADLKPGDRVFSMGGHRSHQRARRADVVPIPAGLAPEVAVFCRLMAVTMTTLTTTTARPGSLVAVSGLGLVGHLAAQNFTAAGYQVIGVDPYAPRREQALRKGVWRAEPAMPLDDPMVKDQVQLVLECSGHEQGALDGCRVVRPRGEVVLVGTPWRRRTDMLAHALTWEVFHRYVVLRSGWEWEVPRQPEAFRVGSIRGNLATSLRWLAEGRVDVTGLAPTVRPEECQAAYQSLLHPADDRLSCVFGWG
ncbi:MAG: zinc-binding alcohol dehydrogenase [Armatimonadetes bacterium]|nr:zinc-binding alcohol dehydrogenase [Armatimonadota bacterium]